MATLHQSRSSIAADGRRLKVRVADVKGFFSRRRALVAWALMAVYAVLPLVSVGGHPAVFIDILRRHFYLFGMTFNAQDVTLMFFFLAGGFLTLILVTTLVGRVWCGWGCPQTVFLENVFRKIERAVEGPKHRQIQFEGQPWTSAKGLRLTLKHGLYLLASVLVAHIFISYFVSAQQLRHWVLEDPRGHWTAFVWMAAITTAVYGNFAWFREQTCMILCPYGKLQSVLTDDDSLVIGYDSRRGEPRGRRGTPGAGDCVNCFRCVDVCPTGIDIREGLQLECIGCSNCVDACDDIMRKLGRPEGLVRYDSLNGLQQKPKRILRPRVLAYAGLWLVLAASGTLAIAARRPFESTLIRQQGMPYVLENGRYRNSYLLHLVNKTPHEAVFDISLDLPAGALGLMPMPKVTLPSMADLRIPVDVELPQALWKGEFEVVARTVNGTNGDIIESRLRFLGPR